MKLLAGLVLLSFAVGAFSCSCPTSKWAMCEDQPKCSCTLLVGDNDKQLVDCTKLVPKCFLMKAQMHRAKLGQDTRSKDKPTEEAFIDNDGVYDPDCEADGKFKARQCNNTETCWCVNSAGVRRTDKGDKNIKCDEVVETYWLQLQMVVNNKEDVNEADLKKGITDAITARYMLSPAFVKDIVYDKDSGMMKVDLKKEKGDRNQDLAPVGWYIEKDIKELPQFNSQQKFEPMVGGKKLQMKSILVYYVDEKGPTFTMKHLTGGIIAVIVVVSLVVVAGLLALFFLRRREQANYRKGQPREMEAMN